ncbi:aspartate--tRNA ligase [Simkania negevensis]|uniref:Aspartate--tRNA(Asp/Asn) ligase n=1 Tax=Simkania negevensis (strain ATCC VR-1471 / DSM 27360 / Z) TaxID=331113 RepID=F8L413_SIMNZ|nr:aspartate--tRNA ligase [Simkania negevensis]CCB90043.1 aspartyl-tRNA synthetase [Simkania negevensis Z]
MTFDYRRTHRCNDLTKSNVEEIVTLSGWVHRRRDHGGLIFIDLRDRYGLTQLIFDPDISKESHEEASKLRLEWVISAKGKVRPRGEGLENPKLATGEIEIEVTEFAVLSKAKTPPFSVCDELTETNEEIRLKYRYLDIRRGDIAQKLVMRHKALLTTRNFFSNQGFLEIATPILGRSTPEGARDYLVPSRIYPGNFYALPQSPQLFKQLLMIGGMDRYFQIAPCFRDEDLRSDRQPEFTQLDIEMSFSTPSEIKKLIHDYLKVLFKECLGFTVPDTIREMNYADCMEHYGTDRPDLRFDMPLVRLDAIAKECEFSVFRDQIEGGGIVKCMCIKGGAEISRKDIDRYTEFVGKFGLKGLAWMKRQAEGLQSSIVKFFSEPLLKEIEAQTKVEEGDLLLFAAADESTVNQAMDHLRRLVARERNLIDPNRYEFLWVVDFPLYEWDKDENRLSSVHHPFTAPHLEDIKNLDSNPLNVRALAYDIIINGFEVGGGSQRIHDFQMQEKIFKALKISEEDLKGKFGFFIEALQYGTPPHLGIALGVDRLIMILTKTENIREVIAFPKTQKASDLMMRCPASVSPGQLHELEIETEPKEITWI